MKIKKTFQDVRYLLVPLFLSILAAIIEERVNSSIFHGVILLFVGMLKDQLSDSTVKVSFLVSMIAVSCTLLFGNQKMSSGVNAVKMKGILEFFSNTFVMIFAIASGLMLGKALSDLYDSLNSGYFYLAWGAYAAFFTLSFMLIIQNMLETHQLAISHIFGNEKIAARAMGLATLVIAIYGVYEVAFKNA